MFTQSSSKPTSSPSPSTVSYNYQGQNQLQSDYNQFSNQHHYQFHQSDGERGEQRLNFRYAPQFQPHPLQHTPSTFVDDCHDPSPAFNRSVVCSSLPVHDSSFWDPALVDSLRHAIEALFSLENLKTNYTIAKHMRSGSIPVTKLLSLPQIRQVLENVGGTCGQERLLLAQAVAHSNSVATCENGKKIGRVDHSSGGDLAFRCVEIRSLPEGSTEASVRALVDRFGEVTHVKLGGMDEEGKEKDEKPPCQGEQALVEFAAPAGALQCVDTLSGTKSNWRSSVRVTFLNGFSTGQVATMAGLEILHAAQEGGATTLKGPQKESTGSGGSCSATSGIPGPVPTTRTSTGTGGPASTLAGACLLPPVLPEGDHTGHIVELEVDAAGRGVRGVLKREGQRRTLVSFQYSDAAPLAVGERVAFSVKHIDSKAVVQNLVVAPPLPSTPLSTLNSGARTGAARPLGGRVIPTTRNGGIMARGPSGSHGFHFPRTRPSGEMLELLDALKLNGAQQKEVASK